MQVSSSDSSESSNSSYKKAMEELMRYEQNLSYEHRVDRSIMKLFFLDKTKEGFDSIEQKYGIKINECGPWLYDYMIEPLDKETEEEFVERVTNEIKLRA